MRAGSHRRSSACCIDAYMPAIKHSCGRAASQGIAGHVLQTFPLHCCRCAASRRSGTGRSCWSATPACAASTPPACGRGCPRTGSPRWVRCSCFLKVVRVPHSVHSSRFSSFMQTLCSAAQAFMIQLQLQHRETARIFQAPHASDCQPALLCTTGRVAVLQLHSWGATPRVADAGRHDAAEAAGACRRPCRSAH